MIDARQSALCSSARLLKPRPFRPSLLPRLPLPAARQGLLSRTPTRPLRGPDRGAGKAEALGRPSPGLRGERRLRSRLPGPEALRLAAVHLYILLAIGFGLRDRTARGLGFGGLSPAFLRCPRSEMLLSAWNEGEVRDRRKGGREAGDSGLAACRGCAGWTAPRRSGQPRCAGQTCGRGPPGRPRRARPPAACDRGCSAGDTHRGTAPTARGTRTEASRLRSKPRSSRRIRCPAKTPLAPRPRLASLPLPGTFFLQVFPSPRF